MTIWSGREVDIPDGWELCTGQEEKISEYPILAALLGNSWGRMSKTTFTLPDLRGVFIRGANDGQDDDTFADPDRNERPGST